MGIVSLAKDALRGARQRAKAVFSAFHAPHQIIGDPPQLLRWRLFPRHNGYNVYLHKFLRDDDDRAMHDHSWSSLSFALRGTIADLSLSNGQVVKRIVRPGNVVWRRATYTHRIELVSKTAWTLFFVGPRIREWGFHCPKGWVHWRVYTKPGPGGRSQGVGRGCE